MEEKKKQSIEAVCKQNLDEAEQKLEAVYGWRLLKGQEEERYLVMGSWRVWMDA